MRDDLNHVIWIPPKNDTKSLKFEVLFRDFILKNQDSSSCSSWFCREKKKFYEKSFDSGINCSGELKKNFLLAFDRLLRLLILFRENVDEL